MDTKFNSKRAREEPQHGGPWTHGSQRRRGCVIRAGYKTGGITQPSGPTFGRFWVPQGTQGYPGPMTFPSGPVSECTNQSEKPSLMKAPSAKKVHYVQSIRDWGSTTSCSCHCRETAGLLELQILSLTSVPLAVTQLG